MVNASTENKENKSLKISSAQLVGGNTDGEKLYLEVELFDGEHTNRYEPEFPLNTTAEQVTEYLKGIIEKNPKLPDDIIGLMQKKVFWDATEEAWYTQAGNEKPVRIKGKSESHSTHHDSHHTSHKK